MKHILIIILISISISSFGQLTSGNVFFGGSISISTISGPSSANGSPTEAFSYGLSPTVGFLLNEKWAIGGQLQYSFSDYKYNYPTYLYESKSTSFGIGILAKRYIQIADKFYFSPTGYVNFARGTTNNTYTGGFNSELKNESYNLSVSLAPRFAFFPSNKWSLETGLGSIYYTFQKDLSSGKDINSLALTFSSAVSFSIYYYLSKQK